VKIIHYSRVGQWTAQKQQDLEGKPTDQNSGRKAHNHMAIGDGYQIVG